jgi:hypothetical protein
MDSSLQPIIYMQGFFRAYGMNKEAGLFATDPVTGALTNNIDFDDTGTQNIGNALASDKYKFLFEPAASKPTWKGKVLGKGYSALPEKDYGWHHPQILTKPWVDNFIKQRPALLKHVYKTMPSARKKIQAEANKELKNRVRPWAYGAAGLAAISIPLLMMWLENKRGKNTFDPHTKDLLLHAASREPGAVFGMSGPSEVTPPTSNPMSGLATTAWSHMNKLVNSQNTPKK